MWRVGFKVRCGRGGRIPCVIDDNTIEENHALPRHDRVTGIGADNSRADDVSAIEQRTPCVESVAEPSRRSSPHKLLDCHETKDEQQHEKWHEEKGEALAVDWADVLFPVSLAVEHAGEANQTNL